MRKNIFSGVAMVLLVTALAFASVGCNTASTSGTSSAGAQTSAKNVEGAVASVSGGVQTVKTKFGPNAYVPITVQKGVPVRWVIQMDAQDLNNCNNAIQAPQLGIEQQLGAGETIIEFTPAKTGTFAYTCWMSMIKSKITVVDNLATVASSSGVDQVVEAVYDPNAPEGCACCSDPTAPLN